MVVAALLVTAAVPNVEGDPYTSVTVQFSEAAYTVNEGGGSATITMTLSAPATQQVTVGYLTTDETATSGSDYTWTSGKLVFEVNETSKTFTIPILQDTEAESHETLSVSVVSVNNAELGNPSTARVTILDDDTPVVVQFDASQYDAYERQGKVTVTVTLSQATGSTVTVEYSTADGTAIAPSDYTAIPMLPMMPRPLLTFQPGETSKSFDVMLVNDEVDVTVETFTVVLSNAVNAILGAVATAKSRSIPSPTTNRPKTK